VPLPRRRYRTDLTDAQWQVLAPLIPAPKPGGRPAVHDRRELVNAKVVVERIFAWLGRCRRLSKDYEFLPATSEAVITWP
jgi:transposase